MVDRLVGEGCPRSEAVEQAMRAVLRDCFLPNLAVDDVYSGRAIVIRRGPDGVPLSSSSEPAIMARMLEQLEARPGHRVLEIGTGTGYNAALLGRLVGPNGQITTVDIDQEITADAERHLRAVDASNVAVVTGDGWEHVPGRSRFDRIEATVGVWDLSPAWVDVLHDDGILVAPLWLRAGLQASVAFIKRGGRLQSVAVEPCSFMRLRGVGAGPETYTTVGEWTAMLDEPDQHTIALLARLLHQAPQSSPAPVLDPGWFTAIALSEPDAINLVTFRDGRPLSHTGILDRETETLAVVESAGLAGAPPTALHVYGGGHAQARLADLVQRSPALELTRLVVDAIPTGRVESQEGRIAVLTRPNFTLLVDAV